MTNKDRAFQLWACICAGNDALGTIAGEHAWRVVAMHLGDAARDLLDATRAAKVASKASQN